MIALQRYELRAPRQLLQLYPVLSSSAGCYFVSSGDILNNGYFIFCPRCPSTVAVRQGEDAWLPYIRLQSVVVVAASGDFVAASLSFQWARTGQTQLRPILSPSIVGATSREESPPQHYCSSKVALAPDMCIQDVSYHPGDASHQKLSHVAPRCHEQMGFQPADQTLDAF